ncbi:hypothetical protein Hamer_G021142, partial [Homarus americanus]
WGHPYHRVLPKGGRIAPENSRILRQQTVGFCPQNSKILPQKTIGFRPQYGYGRILARNLVGFRLRRWKESAPEDDRILLQNTDSAPEYARILPKETVGYRSRKRYDSVSVDGRILSPE